MGGEVEGQTLFALQEGQEGTAGPEAFGGWAHDGKKSFLEFAQMIVDP
jgi:hypothetical protein